MKKGFFFLFLLIMISVSIFAEISVEVESYLPEVEHSTGDVDTIFVSYRIDNTDSLSVNGIWSRVDLVEDSDSLEFTDMILICDGDTLDYISNPSLINFFDFNLEIEGNSFVIVDLSLHVFGEGNFDLQLLSMIFAGGLTINPGLITHHEVVYNPSNLNFEVELSFENLEIEYSTIDLDTLFVGYQFTNYGDSISMVWTRFDLDWDNSLQVNQMRLICQDDTLAVIDDLNQINIIPLIWLFASEESKELLVSFSVSGSGELSVLLEECIFDDQFTINPEIQTYHQVIWNSPQTDILVNLYWIEEEYTYCTPNADVKLFELEFSKETGIDTAFVFYYEVDPGLDLEVQSLWLVCESDTLTYVENIGGLVLIPLVLEITEEPKIVSFWFFLSGEGCLNTDFVGCQLLEQIFNPDIQTQHQITQIYDENNLLLNGCFEMGTLCPWIVEDNGTATYYVDSTEVYMGNYSLFIDPNQNGEFYEVQIWQPVDLEQCQEYWFGLAAKSVANRTIFLNCYENGPPWYNGGLWYETEVTTEWQLITGEFLATFSGSLRFSLNFGHQDIPVWVDFIFLTDIPPVENGHSLVVSKPSLTNYPNPFNPITNIEYGVSDPGNVMLEVYNLKGQKVVTLVDNEFREAGLHSVIWNGRDEFGKSVASGIYFYKMKAGKFVQTKKMILMK